MNKRHVLTNTIISNTMWILRQGFRKTEAPIWKAIELELAGRRAGKRVVNLSRLDNVTENDQVVIIPGKILGTGTIGHKLIVCSFSISERAATKIIKAGGKVITIQDMINTYPDGKGVRIIG